MDSLKHMALISVLENEYSIRFEQSEIVSMVNLEFDRAKQVAAEFHRAHVKFYGNETSIQG